MIMIYIPIWLDLLYLLYFLPLSVLSHLHSNMVRFIIPNAHTVNALLSSIYIPIWLDLLFLLYLLASLRYPYLHSNMVRFIILTLSKSSPFQEPFTFQYG